MAENGDSIIAVIEQVRGKGKTLVPFEPPPLNEIEKKLADNEVLDPESPDEMFESYARRGLFRRWSRHMRRPSFTRGRGRSEEHTSELQSLMRISYAGFCSKKKKQNTQHTTPLRAT